MNIEQYADTPFGDAESMHDFLFANEVDHYRIASFLRQNSLAISEVPLGANEGPTQSWLTDHYNTHVDIGYRLNIQVPDLSGYDLTKEEDHVEWMEVHSATHQLIAQAINAYVPKLNAGAATTSIIYPGPAPSGDPYWADVSLLLHMDGANGGSLFPDSSPRTKVMTTSGVTTSTAQSMFGSASAIIATTTNANVLTTPSGTDFLMSADFSLECFVFFTNVLPNTVILTKESGTSYYPWQLWVSGSKIGFRGFNTSGSLIYNLTGTTTLLNGAWYFVQGIRSGNTFTVAINGSVEASTTITATPLYSAGDPVCIGNYSSTAQYPVIGYIDELRITNGYARPISLPTAPFPNHA